MGSISNWILSIIGMVLVLLLIDVLLPNGKTSKIIKSVLAVCFVLVIIMPIRNIDFNNFDYRNFFTDFTIDQEFVENVRENMVENLKKDCENNLENSGYLNVSVDFETSNIDENLQIKKVYVDLRNLVLLDEKLNIDKYTNIIAIIKSLVNIEEDCVVFYE